MAEFFLSKESAQRKSLNDNYESLGAILADVDFDADFGAFTVADVDKYADVNGAECVNQDKMDPRDVAAEQAQREIDAITASIDPTPWSEIEKRYAANKTRFKPRPKAKAPQKASHGRPLPATHLHYERNEPLPIPNMATALETAAAIASSSNNVVAPGVALLPTSNAPQSTIAPVPEQPDQSGKLSNSVASLAANNAQGLPMKSLSVKQFPSGGNIPGPVEGAANPTKPPSPRSPHRHHHRQQRDFVAWRHAEKHIQSRESLKVAASKKAQYGFGENHKVPSVPLPAPYKVPLAAAIAKESLPRATSPSASSVDASGGNVGAAYERKKQRAKDARVKLNESIERLAIAISLAGTQSKQRISLLDQIRQTDSRQKTIHTMDECAQTADSAKKWDRPSFVGTAASLIQGLTSQCESLTRELSTLHRKIEEYERNETPTAVTPTINGSTDQKRHVVAGQDDGERPTKRICVVGSSGGPPSTICTVKIEEEVPISDEKVIFTNVAKFLDPASLGKCMCVCKKWNALCTFDADQPWLECAIRRFGNYNVRQWLDKLDERSLSKREVYRILGSENVMPHIPSEGMVLLGDARMPGRLSGRAYLVERSNGETIRSVKRPPSGYTASLSKGSSGSSNDGYGNGTFVSLPVVEMRVVLQNIGMASSIVLPDQFVAVDTSTRRSGGELKEIYWDDRFTKALTKVDGSEYPASKPAPQQNSSLSRELCRLDLFDTVVIHLYIHAQGCSTLTKFQQRSNYTKLLVCIDGTTVPMVVPFFRDVPHVL